MYKDLDEQELVSNCLKKDSLAEEELYRRYAARVYTLCRRYCKDEDDAKDLMQDSLIQALERINTFKYNGKGSLYAWIRRIAINKAVNQIKRQRWKMLQLDLSFWGDSIPEPNTDEIDAIPEEKLIEWIAAIPDAKRMVFNLYCMDGYSHKQISEMLGISEKGSAGMLAKARKQLKKAISDYLKEQGR